MVLQSGKGGKFDVPILIQYSVHLSYVGAIRPRIWMVRLLVTSLLQGAKKIYDSFGLRMKFKTLCWLSGAVFPTNFKFLNFHICLEVQGAINPSNVLKNF